MWIMEKPVILSYVKLTDDVEALLSRYGRVYQKDSPELEKILPEVDVVLCFYLNAEHLRKMRKLRLIQSVAAGVDALPWSEIPENVMVCSNAGSNSDAVAEHAWALILAEMKNLHIHAANMREGIYDSSPGARSLAGLTIGIIGMGSIGRRIAEVAKAFKMRVMATTRSGRSSLECDFVGGPEAIDKVLSESDIVVLAAPLTKHTRWMIDKRRLELMKKDAILVNIARADLVKRDDLIEFLRANPEFRFASDVWWHYKERFVEDAEITRFKNVIGTPWVAGGLGNDEVWFTMLRLAAENVVRFLKGETPHNIVSRSDYV